MRTVLAWVLGLAAALGLHLAFQVRGGDTAPRTFYEPDDYVRRANDFIRRGGLEAVCDPGQVRIVTTRPPGGTEETRDLDWSWYDDSYLERDRQRFNASPDNAWTFLIDENCRLLGVHEDVHTIRLPFAQDHRWMGEMYYSGREADAALSSNRRSLLLRRPEEPEPSPRSQLEIVGQSRSGLSEDLLLGFSSERPAARSHHVGERVVLTHRVPETDPGFLRLLGWQVPIGRSAWLETGDWLLLDSATGSSEVFVFSGEESRPLASRIRRRNDRSTRVPSDDGLGWVPDEVRGEWDPFVHALTQAIDASLSRLPGEGREPLRRSHLQLTIHQQLQRRLNEVLLRHFRELEADPEVRDDFEAGVTVMDGKSGEVLALVTFPWREDLSDDPLLDARSRRRRLMNQNFVRHPIGSAFKPFLFAAAAQAHPEMLELRLVPHAGEEKRQEVLHCFLDDGYQVLGAGGGPGGLVDISRAIELSSNRYAVELLMLTLAAEAGVRRPAGEVGLRALLPEDDATSWPGSGRSSGVVVGTEALDYAPSFGPFAREVVALDPEARRADDSETTAAAVCGPLDRVDETRLAETLSLVTGASTYLGEAPRLDGSDRELDLFYSSYVTARYDLRVWKPLVDRLLATPGIEADWRVRAALRYVTPERVNLALNHLVDLRRDLVSFALGGASSSWTNIQLAEAVSRLVTDRAVTARLLSEVIEPPATASDSGGGPFTGPAGPPVAESAEGEEPAALDLSPEVRRAVLEGMRRVVEGGAGTAKELREVLARIRAEHPDRRIYLLSKTGSPVLERPVPRLTAEALDLLVPGDLDLDQGEVVVKRSAGPPFIYRRDRRADAAALLEAALRREGVTRGPGRLAYQVLRIVDRYLGDRPAIDYASESQVPANHRDTLYSVGGRLHVNRSSPLFRSAVMPDKGSVFVFSLVSLPSELAPASPLPSTEQIADPRSQVVSVAVHLTIGPDAARAVEMARTLLSAVDLLEWLQ